MRWLLGAVLVLGVLSSLARYTDTRDLRAEYKPPLLPVKLEMTSSGWSVTGDGRFATPVGTFEVGGKVSKPSGKDTVRVLLLDRHKGPTGSHDIFDVQTGGGKFVVITNGTTRIQVMDRTVEIDVTGGAIQEISFNEVDGELPKSDAEGGLIQRWFAYWKWSPYEPFDLSIWAYDDSTISKWYGIGFAWFLVRLLVAILLGVVDLVLTLIFLVAGLLDVLVGETAKNVTFGVFALIGFGLVLIIILAWRDS